MIGRADKNGPQGDGVNEDVSFTLNTIDRHGVCHASGFCTEHSANSRSIGYEDERSPTLRAGVTPAVLHNGTNCAEVDPHSYGLDRASFNQGVNAQYDFTILPEQQPTLTARGPGAVCTSDTEEDCVRRNSK